MSLDLEAVFANARELSRACTTRDLTRGPGLLHVAAAHVAMWTTLASADERRLAVAKPTGLDVVDITRRVSRRKS
jgi:hypothetical protein